MSGIFVEKRDGSKEPLDLEKIHKVLGWAVDGIKGVSISEIELRSQLQFFEGIKSKEIHETLTKTAADLISEETPNYQYVASKLVSFNLRKEVYGQPDPWHLLKLVERNIGLGFYTSELLEWYTKEEWEKMNKMIKHDRDYNIVYAGMGQWLGKYLIQNRVTKQYYETPQIAYMLIAASAFHAYPEETRLKYVKDYYDALSNFDISIPTPVLGGLRTKTKQFSSCFPAGQKVLTNKGYKNIENIKVSDEVLTFSGKYNPVIATRKKSYSEELVDINSAFSIKGEFTSTKEHLIKSIKKNSNKEEWIEAQNLNKGDWTNIPYHRHIDSLDRILLSEFIDIPSNFELGTDGYIRQLNIDPKMRCGKYKKRVHPVKNEILLDKEFFRFLGYYAAEGALNSRSIALCFNKNENEYLDDVENLGIHIFGIKFRRHPSYIDNSISIGTTSQILPKLLDKLIGRGSHTKRLHTVIMNAKPENQKEFLIGIIRGDGCSIENGVQLGLSNRDLIYQCAEMALRCKLSPSLGKTPKKEKYFSNRGKTYTLQEGFIMRFVQSTNYDFILSVGKNLHKLKKRHEPNACVTSKWLGNNFYSKIHTTRKYKIEKKIDVYDLQVLNDSSFVVNGICVHNCTVISCGDSLNSINATASAIVNYVSKRAGIGLDVGRIRAQGSEIRGGEAKHTGVIPFLKYFQAALKSCCLEPNMYVEILDEDKENK